MFGLLAGGIFGAMLRNFAPLKLVMQSRANLLHEQAHAASANRWCCSCLPG